MGFVSVSAHVVAVTASSAEVAARLEEVLGARITASIAGVADARAVHQWATGARMINSPRALNQLRTAYQAALELAGTNDVETVRAWFETYNPALEYRSPIQLLRDDQIDESAPRVLAAAMGFVAVNGQRDSA